VKYYRDFTAHRPLSKTLAGAKIAENSLKH
jgi:hypothetical protein